MLANQFISQIKDERIVQAVFGNVGTFVCFRLGREDSLLVEPQFLPYLDRVDPTNLPSWHMAARTAVNGKGLPAFTVQTILPDSQPDPAVASRVRELSRRNYARPRRETEGLIAGSLSAPEDKWQPLSFDDLWGFDG